MVRTRAAAAEATPATKEEDTRKRTHSKIQESAGTKNRVSKKTRKETDSSAPAKPEEGPEKKVQQKSPAKKSGQNAKINSLIEKYGSIPLSKTELADPSSPHAETILALVLNAMLSSARISHELAARTVDGVIKADYHKFDVLKKSSWQERTEVLTEGGYTRYREKTATAFGDLAELIESKYNGDLNNLLKRAGKSPPKIREALKEIKGIGDVGVDIFFDTAQAVWPCLAPFVDPRSKKTADEIGIGSDVGKLWKEVGEDPVRMCKLASALTKVRLEKREAQFKT